MKRGAFLLEAEEKFMQRAIRLAKRGEGRVSPNPLVGALIVKRGKVIAEGYHRKAGLPHAEVNALNLAGSQSRGATLYVNLEPCAHYGRTPPCSKAIIRAGIKRVVVGIEDPNPLVSGKGIRELEGAGIKTIVGVLEDASRRLNQTYIKYITTKLPYLSLKMAMSLDGKIATKTGSSFWISGEASRSYVQRLRSLNDAVLVGIGTVIKDDPELAVRLKSKSQALKKKKVIRIIVDSKARIPLNANVLTKCVDNPTIIATTKYAPLGKIRALKARGAKVVIVKDREEKVDLGELMKKMGRLQISSILVEGGGNINASFLKEGLVDKVLFFIAPKIIGGRRSLTPVEGEGIKDLREAIKLTEVKVRKVGEDLLVEGDKINYEF